METGALSHGTGPNGPDIASVIEGLTRVVHDFPEPGIVFRDLTPVLADQRGFEAVTDALAQLVAGADLIAGIDARGPCLGQGGRGQGRGAGPRCRGRRLLSAAGASSERVLS